MPAGRRLGLYHFGLEVGDSDDLIGTRGPALMVLGRDGVIPAPKKGLPGRMGSWGDVNVAFSSPYTVYPGCSAKAPSMTTLARCRASSRSALVVRAPSAKYHHR